MSGSADDWEVGFEEIYAGAGDRLGEIPWASLAPDPELVAWLANGAPAPGFVGPSAWALIVGCGLGDDAEAVAAAGRSVTAFDVSPTAIDRCRQRWPSSPVDYAVADVLALPDAWRRAFGLVVEIRTLQSLPLGVRPAAVAAIAETIAPGGTLYVRAFSGEASEQTGPRPWPVTRAELAGFEAAGLRRESVEERTERQPLPVTVAVYRRD